MAAPDTSPPRGAAAYVGVGCFTMIAGFFGGGMIALMVGLVVGYRVMTSFVKRLHDGGERLAVGTDVPDPGKAVLSEMLLLHDAGIPMADVFRIATLHGAMALGQETQLGVVEPGRRANLVVFVTDICQHDL